jgi:hypothetical protein
MHTGNVRRLEDLCGRSCKLVWRHDLSRAMHDAVIAAISLDQMHLAPGQHERHLATFHNSWQGFVQRYGSEANYSWRDFLSLTISAEIGQASHPLWDMPF